MQNEEGFTLIEVIVSLGLFSIITAGVLPGFLYFTKYNTDSEIKQGAVEAAQKTLDGIRLLDPSTLPTTGSVTTTSVSGGERSYSVTVSYCQNATYCTSANMRHISVSVSYKGTTKYSVETVYTKLR